jgi:hypothetical protein
MVLSVWKDVMLLQVITKLVCLFVLVVLGFELRASVLLGRQSTT